MQRRGLSVVELEKAAESRHFIWPVPITVVFGAINGSIEEGLRVLAPARNFDAPIADLVQETFMSGGRCWSERDS